MRMFLAFVAMIAAATIIPTTAFAQERVRVREQHVHENVRVRVREGGPRMMYGQQYGSISYGHRGLLAVGFSIGMGGQRSYGFMPVRRIEPGSCVVRVDSRRPRGNLEVEVERMTDGCYHAARLRGDLRPRIVVDLY